MAQRANNGINQGPKEHAYKETHKNLKLAIQRSKSEYFELCSKAHVSPWRSAHRTVMAQFGDRSSSHITCVTILLKSSRVYSSSTDSFQRNSCNNQRWVAGGWSSCSSCTYLGLSKAGESPGEPLSYRPICLLCSVGSMLEQGRDCFQLLGAKDAFQIASMNIVKPD